MLRSSLRIDNECYPQSNHYLAEKIEVVNEFFFLPLFKLKSVKQDLELRKRKLRKVSFQSE